MGTSDSDEKEGIAPHIYILQLARTLRFLQHYKDALAKGTGSGESLNNLEDNLWAFFHNCWHLKDWIRHDVTLDEPVRRRLLAAAEANDALQLVADLANGTRHFKLTNVRVGAREGFHPGPSTEGRRLAVPSPHRPR